MKHNKCEQNLYLINQYLCLCFRHECAKGVGGVRARCRWGERECDLLCR